MLSNSRNLVRLASRTRSGVRTLVAVTRHQSEPVKQSFDSSLHTHVDREVG